MPKSEKKKRPSTRYRPFEEAREYARSLGLKTQDDWVAFIRGEIHDLPQKPSDIPNCPDFVYKGHGWAGFRNWLGLAHGRSIPFEEARKYARSLGLKLQSEWLEFARGKRPDIGKKPKGIPIYPRDTYRRYGWISWADWLGFPENRWRPFEAARDYARSLNLESRMEWVKFTRGQRPDIGQKPFDIPATPLAIYKRCGWCGYRDWLDWPVKNPWRSFEEARLYARTLGLKSKQEWLDFARGKRPDLGKKPDDIPVRPLDVYIRLGWCGYEDWLGLEAGRWRSYAKARKFVRRLGLETIDEWRLYRKGEFRDTRGIKPENIPAAPDVVYQGKGWTNWGDFLGNGMVEVADVLYEPFFQARKYVRSLNLKSAAEWFSFCKESSSKIEELNYPLFPNTIYRGHGWTSWSDFLGVRSNSRNCSYKEAREFARSLGLKSNEQWRSYCRGDFVNKPQRPENIVTAPDAVYKGKGWISWGDFLGTGTVSKAKRIIKPFEAARIFARKLKLSGEDEWRKYCRGQLPEKGIRPEDIPSNPNRTYRHCGWINWGDFLGTNNIANYNKKYRLFKEAQKFARSLNLKKATEWWKYAKDGLKGKPKKPDDIPANPHNTYRNKGWVSWGNFLGTGAIAAHKRIYRPFEDARKFVRNLNLRSSVTWRDYIAGRLPDKPLQPTDIPSHPDSIYKDKGWISWSDWIGTTRARKKSRQ